MISWKGRHLEIGECPFISWRYLVPAVAVDDHRGFRPRPKRDRPATTPALGRTPAVLRNSIHLRRTSSRVTVASATITRRLSGPCLVLDPPDRQIPHAHPTHPLGPGTGRWRPSAPGSEEPRSDTPDAYLRTRLRGGPGIRGPAYPLESRT